MLGSTFRDYSCCRSTSATLVKNDWNDSRKNCFRECNKVQEKLCYKVTGGTYVSLYDKFATTKHTPSITSTYSQDGGHLMLQSTKFTELKKKCIWSASIFTWLKYRSRSRRFTLLSYDNTEHTDTGSAFNSWYRRSFFSAVKWLSWTSQICGRTQVVDRYSWLVRWVFIQIQKLLRGRIVSQSRRFPYQRSTYPQCLLLSELRNTYHNPVLINKTIHNLLCVISFFADV